MYSPVKECCCGCPESSAAGSYANVHCWAQSLVIRVLKDSVLQHLFFPVQSGWILYGQQGSFFLSLRSVLCKCFLLIAEVRFFLRWADDSSQRCRVYWSQPNLSLTFHINYLHWFCSSHQLVLFTSHISFSPPTCVFSPLFTHPIGCLIRGWHGHNHDCWVEAEEFL